MSDEGVEAVFGSIQRILMSEERCLVMLTLTKNWPKAKLNRTDSFQFKKKPILRRESVCYVEPRQRQAKIII